MIRVGIVGENYHNDSVALKNLLERRYDINKIQFVPMLKGTTGDKLASRGIRRLLEIEIAKKSKKGKIHFIIFFRDLDRLPSDAEKIKDRQDWFEFVKMFPADALFLAIFESEALLLADIEAVNQCYNIKLSYNKNPLSEKEPKEYLRRKTKEKYKQSDCPELFKLLNIEVVCQKHIGDISFQSFIQELDKKLNYT